MRSGLNALARSAPLRTVVSVGSASTSANTSTSIPARLSSRIGSSAKPFWKRKRSVTKKARFLPARSLIASAIAPRRK